MAPASESRSVTRVKKKTVFVVDDHPLLRQGLALLINREKDLEVCGEAEEAQTAMREIAAKKPNILIADISLNGPDGLELLKNIRALYPSLPVLILSMHDESIYAERALRARANGYIMKQEATEKVLVAVRRILGGDIPPNRRRLQYTADCRETAPQHKNSRNLPGSYQRQVVSAQRARAGATRHSSEHHRKDNLRLIFHVPAPD
jgi:DNA-binding NarL/FixJ family response regulator